MKTEARYDRKALETIFLASMQVPCIKEKLAGFTEQQFINALNDHEVLGFYRGDLCIGGCVWKNGIGHISILQAYKRLWCNRETLKEFWILWTRNGPHVKTTVDKRNPEGIRFLDKLGLKPTAISGYLITYEGDHYESI
jgi:hypothetical protein